MSNNHWKCEQCGYCCRSVHPISLTEFDVWRIFNKWASAAMSDGEILPLNLALLGLQDVPFLTYDKYMAVPSFCLPNEKGKACIFLKDDKCTIYSTRPSNCRYFPLYVDNYGTKHLSITISACPQFNNRCNYPINLSFSESIIDDVLRVYIETTYIKRIISDLTTDYKVKIANNIDSNLYKLGLVEFREKIIHDEERKKQFSFKKMRNYIGAQLTDLEQKGVIEMYRKKYFPNKTFTVKYSPP